MHRSPGILRPAVHAEQPVIMRIITTATLALLLLFAFAVTAHSDAGEDGSSPSLAALTVDAYDQAYDPPAAADQEQITTAAPTAGSASLAGVALCVLGVLCALAALLVVLRLSRRLARASHLRDLLRVHLPPASAPRPRVTAISLTQLGVSRT